MLIALRQLWNNPVFWRNLLKVVAAHIIVFAFLAQVLPLGRFGFPKIILTVGCILEGLLIASFLSKKAGIKLTDKH